MFDGWQQVECTVLESQIDRRAGFKALEKGTLNEVVAMRFPNPLTGTVERGCGAGSQHSRDRGRKLRTCPAHRIVCGRRNLKPPIAGRLSGNLW
jgi:hypothetical protein